MGLFSSKNKEKKKLVELIKQGVIYEEEFIDTYGNLLKEEEFLQYFGDKKELASELLDQLINESSYHKTSLEAVLKKFE